MTALERGFALQVARILHNAAKRAAADVEAFGMNANIDAALTDLPDQLRQVFVPHYTKTADVFGRRLLEAFKSHAKYETKSPDIFAETMREWIQRTSADKVVGIADVTKRRIRAAINESFAANATGSEAARAIIGKTGGAIARQRAIVIARTETHMAASEAGLEAVRSTGVPAKKIWISAEDERTRETHSAADSESHASPLAMDELFSVGSDSMSAPGLGSDPAENVNCRCVTGWITE
jgi:hypothetical protein